MCLSLRETCSKIKDGEYERKHETHYTHTEYIAEFWNTLSNLPFIIIGFIRLIEITLYQNDAMKNIQHMIILYSLFVAAGFCSGIHHTLLSKWTIILDWIPIASSLIYLFYYIDLLVQISPTCWFEMIIAIGMLFADHVFQYVTPPWGHVFWHIIASFAMDNAYQNMLY